MSDEIFVKIKELAFQSSGSNHIILRSLLFQTFFLKPEYSTVYSSLYGVLRCLHNRNLKIIYIRYKIKKSNKQILLVDTLNAKHYQKINNHIEDLLNKQNYYCSYLSQSNTKIGFKKNFLLAIKSLCFCVWFLVAALSFGVKLSKLLAYLPQLITNLKYYYFNQPIIASNINNFKAILVLSENWLPMSLLILVANKLNVLTIHYPHGTLNRTVLPLQANLQLFWNDKMKNNYHTYEKKSMVVGFVESYSLKVIREESNSEKKILITSQLNGLKEGNERFRDIFYLWKKVISQLDIHLFIKMHPFDRENHIKFINDLFEDFDNVQIVSNIETLESSLAKVNYHTTVSSGSILTSIKMGVPTLLFGSSLQLEENGIGELCYTYYNEEDLLRLLTSNLNIEKQPLWLEDSFIKDRFNQLTLNIEEFKS